MIAAMHASASLRRLFTHSLAAALAALSAAGALATTGTAVPIGGALRNDNAAVWTRLVQAAGGPGARFVVFGTASIEPEASAEDAAKTLRQYGAVATVVPVAPMIKGLDVAAAVRDPRYIAQVKAARGVFFTGGSQDRIVETLQPLGKRTPLLEAIWSVFNDGGVVAGTSAGAAIMSAQMFRDAPDLVAVLKGRLREGKELATGLGFVGPALFVDQHFLRRGRIGRLLPAMVDRGYQVGLGVDENTAAFVHGDDIEVVGAHGAILVDLTQSRRDSALGAFNVQNARVSFLAPGDGANMKTRVVTPSASQLKGQRIVPGDKAYTPENDSAPFYVDILGEEIFAGAMANLIDNKAGELRGLAFDAQPAADDARPALGFEFRLAKDSHTLGWYSDASGDDLYTVIDMRLDVTPVRVATPLYAPWKP
ncbi:MAG: cyanophycinase [Betaproteobacteria bacterium]